MGPASIRRVRGDIPLAFSDALPTPVVEIEDASAHDENPIFPYLLSDPPGSARRRLKDHEFCRAEVLSWARLRESHALLCRTLH